MYLKKIDKNNLENLEGHYYPYAMDKMQFITN